MIEDTFDGKTNYCTHKNTNESGICDNCLGKPNPQQSTVEERFDKIKDELYKHTISVEKDGYMSVSGFIKLNDLKEVFESEIQLAEQKAEKKGWDNAFKHVSNTLAVAYGTVFIKKDTLIYIPSVEEIQQKAREEGIEIGRKQMYKPADFLGNEITPKGL